MGRLGNSCVCTAVRSDVLRSRCCALRNARIADDVAVVVMDDIVVWTAPMGLFETAEWIALCNAAGLPCGPVNSMDEVFENPQVKHLKVARSVRSSELDMLELSAQPIEFEGAPFALRRAAPPLGEHNELMSNGKLRPRANPVAGNDAEVTQ